METGIEKQQESVNNFIAFTPTIILPLMSSKEESYTVRTLLDSGSESNWIARDVLKYIKHTKVGVVRLRVRHFDGVTPKKFQLVQLYIRRADKWRPDRHSFAEIGKIYDKLNCIVYEGFFHHRYVTGLKQFIRDTGKISEEVCVKIIEPSYKVDHQELNLGTALVLSNAGKLKIMEENTHPIMMRKSGLMLEPTVFGYAVSGSIP